MNAVFFNRLQNTLQSLRHSTDLTIEVGGIAVTLGRQQSPYASHRSVEFAQATPPTPWTHAALFHNHKAACMIDLVPRRNGGASDGGAEYSAPLMTWAAAQ